MVLTAEIQLLRNPIAPELADCRVSYTVLMHPVLSLSLFLPVNVVISRIVSRALPLSHRDQRHDRPIPPPARLTTSRKSLLQSLAKSTTIEIASLGRRYWFHEWRPPPRPHQTRAKHGACWDIFLAQPYQTLGNTPKSHYSCHIRYLCIVPSCTVSDFPLHIIPVTSENQGFDEAGGVIDTFR
jgi:hypothetical protein